MALADDLLGDDSNDLDINQISNGLLLQAINQPNKSNDPEFLKKKANRDALYNQIVQASKNPSGMSTGQDIGTGIAQALGSGLALGLGGSNSRHALDENAQQFNAIRNRAAENQKAQTHANLTLLNLADKDIKTGYGKPIDPLGLLRRANDMQHIQHLGTTDAENQDYRQQRLALEAQKLQAAKDKLAMGGVKPEQYPGQNLTKQTKEELANWKYVDQVLNTEKVRSVLGQTALRETQGKFVKGVFDAVPPPGVSRDAWQDTLHKNPNFLDNETSDKRIIRFNQMIPFQKYEAVAGYVRQITGTDPSDHSLKVAFPNSIGDKASTLNTYLNSWKQGKLVGTNDGEVMDLIYNGMKRESDIAHNIKEDQLGVALGSVKPWLDASPARKAILEKKLNDPSSFTKEYRGNGGSSSGGGMALPSQDAIDAELAKRGVK